MAIFHLSAEAIKRSSGRSVVACAAYRAAAKLEDRRTGQVFDYSHRGGVLHSQILAPAGAPRWMRDRAELWNRVEAGEKRKDARLAREVRIALPHELTNYQRLELTREFVKKEFVARGMVADIAIHGPNHDGDKRNYHAHILLTLREIEGDGFGKVQRDWNKREELGTWRKEWADFVNRALEREGVATRVDHRSLEAQGIDRTPQLHLGQIASEMERRGVETDRGGRLRAVVSLSNALEIDAEELKRLSRSRGARYEWAARANMVAQQESAQEWLEQRERSNATKWTRRFEDRLRDYDSPSGGRER